MDEVWYGALRIKFDRCLHVVFCGATIAHLASHSSDCVRLRVSSTAKSRYGSDRTQIYVIVVATGDTIWKMSVDMSDSNEQQRGS